MYVYVCGHKETQICQMRSNKRAEVMIVTCYLKSSKFSQSNFFPLTLLMYLIHRINL